MKFLAVFLLISTMAFGQNPDAIKYSSRQILLVDPAPGAEGILPMISNADGQQRLIFVPVHEIKDAIDKGGRPVTLANILSILGAATEKVNQLQAENDRLWKVAMKDAPRPSTVVVQQQPREVPSEAEIAERRQAEADARRQQALQTWMQMQNANRTQNLNVNVTNCTRYPALCMGK